MTGVGEALTIGRAQWQEGAAKKTQDINTFPMLREAVVRRINGSVCHQVRRAAMVLSWCRM
jgi:hypothetical protein